MPLANPAAPPFAECPDRAVGENTNVCQGLFHTADYIFAVLN